MKLENLEQAKRLGSKLKDTEKALTELEANLVKYTTDTDGSNAASETALYNFYLAKYKDGSGFGGDGLGGIDLTGLCVGLEIMRFVRGVLVKKRLELIKQIELL